MPPLPTPGVVRPLHQNSAFLGKIDLEETQNLKSQTRVGESDQRSLEARDGHRGASRRGRVDQPLFRAPDLCLVVLPPRPWSLLSPRLRLLLYPLHQLCSTSQESTGTTSFGLNRKRLERHKTLRGTRGTFSPSIRERVDRSQDLKRGRWTGESDGLRGKGVGVLEYRPRYQGWRRRPNDAGTRGSTSRNVSRPDSFSPSPGVTGSHYRDVGSDTKDRGPSGSSS